MPGYVLAMAGYDSKAAASTQDYMPSQSALSGILFMSIGLPAIICIAAGILMWFGYRINNKKYKEMVDELNRRREVKKTEMSNKADVKVV